MKLRMELGKQSYDIIINRGGLKRASQLCNLKRRVLVVTDDGVPPAYAKTILAQCAKGELVVLPQGEGTKSIAAWQGLLARMLEAGFGRGDAVAAVGGGVVGDLAGFAAAAYMRGVDLFQFPTTVLSQLDSSIGGKVAVNLEGAKNIVGAFHQPGLVVADPNTLDTLPPRQFANGLAEAVKTGLIGSTPLFELLETGDAHADIEQILYLAMRYKKGVVERDETEQGERKLLNFGHTIGHGIEAYFNEEDAALPQTPPASGDMADAQGNAQHFQGGLTKSDGLHPRIEATYLHGECVALGMLPMIQNRALLRRTRAVLKKLGLPLATSFNAERVLSYIKSDKKRDADGYTVVRVEQLGRGYLDKVSYEELERLVHLLA